MVRSWLRIFTENLKIAPKGNVERAANIDKECVLGSLEGVDQRSHSLQRDLGLTMKVGNCKNNTHKR